MAGSDVTQVYSVEHALPAAYQPMPEIIVYSSNMCSTCEMVKQFLVLRGVEFTEKNVSTDLDGRAELIALGHDSTPVTVIGDRVLAGFDTNEIDAALQAI